LVCYLNKLQNVRCNDKDRLVTVHCSINRQHTTPTPSVRTLISDILLAFTDCMQLRSFRFDMIKRLKNVRGDLRTEYQVTDQMFRSVHSVAKYT